MTNMTMHQVKISSIKTSRFELIDISKAWIVLSLAFAFVYTGAHLIGGDINRVLTMQFLKLFIVSMGTAGLGFLLHELAHKFVAQRYGCVAEFRAFDQMLYLALGLAVVIGFIFAAPGAVMISGMITRRENGIVSLAGPLTNYVLGMIFMGLMMVVPAYSWIFAIGFSINMWLGLFNMIPFGNFDGYKIFQWNVPVWLGMVAVGVFFVFFR